jgi:MraZ protein
MFWGRHFNTQDFLYTMWRIEHPLQQRLETHTLKNGKAGVVIMFMGQYEHSIDTKGRVIIPAKYREGLGECFVVTRGLDGCLFLYPTDEWGAFVEKLQNLPSNQKTRRIQRQFLSSAMEVALDKQGRILIPAMLREAASLEKEIVFVGMMNRVEVWDKSLLEKQELHDDEEALEEAMDELDISL